MEGFLKKNTLAKIILLALLFGSFGLSFLSNPQKVKAADANNLCSDSAFVNASALDQNGVQNFLKSKGSFLANYSDGGRTAAQIIYGAAKENGLNPYVILAMIQKEEGLITGTHSKSLSQVRLDWAMGYGYTDSEIMGEHKGFTKQVENGAWQLKRNYSYWASNGSRWNVGKTMVIDGKTVKFGNRCTSAQYRYTPHLGVNFSNYFSQWGGGGVAAAPSGTFEAQIVTQGPRVGAGAPGVNLAPNQRFMVWVNYKNTGGAIWYPTSNNSVKLGTADPQDRASLFMGGKSARGNLVQKAVKPGQIGTFQVWLTAPSEPGAYTEKFKIVVDKMKWMGEEATYTFNVVGKGGSIINNTATSPATTSPVTPEVKGVSTTTYSAQFVTQGPRVGPGSPNYTLNRSQGATLWVNFRNTGSSTWYKNGVNATHLGLWDPQDRNSVFTNNTNRRGYLVQTSVKPGAIGTFVIPITAPRESGSFTEKFRPVTEHITWFGDTTEWKFTVR